MSGFQPSCPKCAELGAPDAKECAACGARLYPGRVENGYVILQVGGLPRVRDHRRIAAQTLGRPLKPGEVVHHINGDRADNRPENLVVLKNSDHSRLHALMRRRSSVLKPFGDDGGKVAA